MPRLRDPLSRALDRLGEHRSGWVVEPLVEEPSFVLKSMFGCLACYLHGRLMLLLADRRPPWRGLLVPTAREAHASLVAEHPALRVHPVLGKWLWLPETADGFETVAERLATLAREGDPRLGVEPRPRRGTIPSMGARRRGRVSRRRPGRDAR